MAIQLLKLDDYLLKTVLKYCTLQEAHEISFLSMRLGMVVDGMFKEKRRMTRDDFYEIGFHSNVISSEIFRGKKLSTTNLNLKKLNLILSFMQKFPNIEEMWLDIILGLTPKGDLPATAMKLASSCPKIVKFTGIEDGEQFLLEYFEAIKEMKKLDNQPLQVSSNIICQINPRDYFWDVHHDSIKKLIKLRGDAIKLVISSKYIDKEYLNWVSPSMICKFNVDMSVDDVNVNTKILSNIDQLVVDWNWARDRPVTPVKLQQFVSLLTNARQITVFKAYEVPDCPQLLQNLTSISSTYLTSVELHILNQGVNVTDRASIDAFVTKFRDQLRSLTIRCDYIKDRANHGMDILFRNSIIGRCRCLKTLELSYYVSYKKGTLTLEQYQEDSLVQLLELFPRTTNIDISFPSDAQVERWIEEFKWYCDLNRRKKYSLKIWRCSKYAIVRKSLEESGPNWSIVEISPDLSDHLEFTFV